MIPPVTTLAPPSARGAVDTIDDALFTDLAELTTLVAGAPWGGVFLLDTEGRRRGRDHGDVFPDGPPPFEDTPCELVLASGEPVVIADAEADGRYAALSRLTGLCSYAGVPVFDGEELIGTACVAFDIPLISGAHDILHALTRIAGQVARQLESHRRMLGRERTEASLRTIVSTLPDGLLLQDGEGRTLLTNPAFSRMLDLPDPDALEGLDREAMRALIAASPVGADQLLALSAAATVNGHAVVGQDLHLTNGRVLEWDFLPQTMPDGASRRVWHIRDVTSRRGAERRLAFSEERFSVLAMAGSPRAGVYHLAADGHPVFLDTLCLELFDAEADDPMAWTRSIHPEDMDKVAAAWTEAMTRQTHYSVSYRLIARGRTRHIEAEAAPLHDADGAFAGFVGTLTDLTPQIEAAQARERSDQVARREHQRLSDLVTGSPEPILSIGTDGRIVGMNPAALTTFAMTRQEGLGKALTELVAGADRAFLRGAMEDVANGGARPATLEVLACGARPRLFLAELVLIPMRRLPVDDDPDTVVMTAIFRDISDQHRAELEHIKRLETERAARQEAEAAQAELQARLEELHAVTRAKDTFVSMISHELRTPLTSIRTFSEFLADDGCDEDSPVAVIARNVDRLERIVGDLLEVKAGIDPAVLHLENVDLRRLVRHEIASLRPAAQAAGVELVAVDGDAVPVCADPGRIGQVIGNLVDNALKFTPAGERVVVDAALRDGAVLLEVRDSGCGIAAEELPRVFERFYQGSAGRSLARGSGLGLSVSALIADAHGGQMDVSSRPGQGTTFTMTLPPAFDDTFEA